MPEPIKPSLRPASAHTSTSVNDTQRRPRPTSAQATAAKRTDFLYTDLLAHDRAKRKKQRDEKRLLQDLKLQQKLMGRKTTDEYAKIRLIHRLDPTKKQHLHQNHVPKVAQPQAKPVAIQEEEEKEDELEQTVDARRLLRPLDTAREPPKEVDSSQRLRPQSAHPLSRSTTSKKGLITGRQISVPLLERVQYTSTPLQQHSATSLHGCRSLSRIFYRQEIKQTIRRHGLRDHAQEEEEDHEDEEDQEDQEHSEPTDDHQTRRKEQRKPQRQHIVVDLRRLQLIEQPPESSSPVLPQLHEDRRLSSVRHQAWTLHS